MEGSISRDELVARFAAFVDQQLATGKQGTRLVEFSLDGRMRITSVKGTARPPRPKRLPPVTPVSIDIKRLT